MLMIAENVSAAPDFCDHIPGRLTQIPPGAGNHPAQNGSEINGHRHGVKGFIRFARWIIEQQCHHGKHLQTLLPHHFPFDLCRAAARLCQHGGQRIFPVFPVDPAIAAGEHIPGRQPHVSPEINHRIQPGMENGMPGHAFQHQCRMQIAPVTQITVIGPLIMPGGLILPIPHGQELFKDVPGKILVRNRIFIVNSNRHCQQIPAQLPLIPMSDDDRLLKWRPGCFQFCGTEEHFFTHPAALFRSQQFITPVINQACRINSRPHFPCHIQPVAEIHRVKIAAHQLCCFLAHGWIFFHEIHKSLFDHRIFQCGIRRDRRAGDWGKLVRSHGPVPDRRIQIPVFPGLQSGTDSGQDPGIDPHSGMGCCGDNGRLVVLHLIRYCCNRSPCNFYRFHPEAARHLQSNGVDAFFKIKVADMILVVICRKPWGGNIPEGGNLLINAETPAKSQSGTIPAGDQRFSEIVNNT